MNIDRRGFLLGSAAIGFSNITDYAQPDTASTASIHGTYYFTCVDAEGNVLWEEKTENAITTVGKNFWESTLLQGSAYTVTGPFMFLIGPSPTLAPSTDTMTSHAGWTEATGYGATRPTVTYGTPSGGVITQSGSSSFVFTTGTTLAGAGQVLGTGATSGTLNTGGTLFSEGTFSSAQTVVSTNTLTVTWSGTLTLRDGILGDGVLAII